MWIRYGLVVYIFIQIELEAVEGDRVSILSIIFKTIIEFFLIEEEVSFIVIIVTTNVLLIIMRRDEEMFLWEKINFRFFLKIKVQFFKQIMVQIFGLKLMIII